MFINHKDTRISLIFVRAHQTCTLSAAVTAVTHRVVGNEELGLTDSLSIVTDRQTDSRDSGTSSCQQRVGDSTNQQGGCHELGIGIYNTTCGSEPSCGHLMENTKIY